MQFDYSKLMDEYNLVDFIVQHLLPGAALDDFVLEVIKWVIYMIEEEKLKKKWKEILGRLQRNRMRYKRGRK